MQPPHYPRDGHVRSRSILLNYQENSRFFAHCVQGAVRGIETGFPIPANDPRFSSTDPSWDKAERHAKPDRYRNPTRAEARRAEPEAGESRRRRPSRARAEARRALLAEIGFLATDRNEWTQDGKNYINGLFKMLHTERSNPGLSDAHARPGSESR